jgi:hypothetical protein
MPLPLQGQAGIKRNAECMQMQYVHLSPLPFLNSVLCTNVCRSQRRPMHGMGLTGGQRGGGGSRQVLGRLEVGVGGDVKRVKR